MDARSLLSVVLLAIGFWIIAVNWVVVWRGWSKRGTKSSLVPLAGGLLAACGLALAPMASFRWFAPLALVVDWGSLPAITLALIKASRR